MSFFVRSASFLSGGREKDDSNGAQRSKKNKINEKRTLLKFILLIIFL